jgi:hypothetical protein
LKIGRKAAVVTLKRSGLEMRKSSWLWKQAKQKLLLLGIESLYSAIMMYMYRGSTNKSLSKKLVKADKIL